MMCRAPCDGERDMSDSLSSSGVGFPGLLTVAFVVLKLTEVIQWSWWWVLSPLWIVTGLVVVVAAAVIVFTLLR